MARPAIEGPSDRVKNKSKMTPPPRDQLRSPPPTSRKHYPKRVSVLPEEEEPAFWLLDSFNETKNWTDNQKDSAIKAVKKLMRDYEIILEEHQEMREHVEEQATDNEEIRQRIESLEENALAFRNDNETLRQDNNDLERELTMKQGQIEYLEQRKDKTETPRTSTKQRARLEDPEKFTGKKNDKGSYLTDKENTIEFEIWRADMESKLRTDAITFDDENHMIAYIGSRTTQAAYDHIRTGMEDNTFKTSKEVLDNLETVYGDPHKAIRAEAELQRLGQTLNGSFHLFHTEFVRITRPLKHDDSKLKSLMISRLNDKFLTAISTLLDLPYQELTAKLYDIDKQFESQRTARESRRQLQKGTTDTYENKTGKPFRQTGRYQLPANTNSTKKKDSQENTNDRPPLRTREEYETLFNAGLCKKCCKPRHVASGNKCQEPLWASMPLHLKPKQVNHIEGHSSSPPVEIDDSKN
jgi:hypothetical protein